MQKGVTNENKEVASSEGIPIHLHYANYLSYYVKMVTKFMDLEHVSLW